MNRIAVLGLGVLAGVLGLAGARFAVAPGPPVTHHHANFAVFVNGERIDLTDDRYMQDVGSCRVDATLIQPPDRVHMHDNNHDVVHVHHPAATWGHLFANLGMALGGDYLFTNEERHMNSEDGSLKFIINGLQVPELQNRAIRSEDRVLISFGPESPEELMEGQFSRVATSAGEFNQKSDPAACQGGHEPEGFGARLKRAFLG